MRLKQITLLAVKSYYIFYIKREAANISSLSFYYFCIYLRLHFTSLNGTTHAAAFLH